jgi:hypothetical protein
MKFMCAHRTDLLQYMFEGVHTTPLKSSSMSHVKPDASDASDCSL